jgi:hypothetical protein
MTLDGGRYALIVAVSDYRDSKLRKLRAPEADAERLAGALENPNIGGFAVDIALNEEEPQLRRRIARFFANRRPDDLLLVHFSCHGVKDEGGELYLAAADTEIGDLLGATGISADWLSEQIDRSRSRRVVVLLDCCFSGSFPFGARTRAGDQINVRDHLDGRGRAVITASSAMEYSYEGDQLSGEGQPSFFTAAVVEGLETGLADRDGDRWISVDDLYNYVYDRVKDRTPWQTPNKLSNLEGPLRIARSVYEPPVQPAQLSDELIGLAHHALASARLAAVDELAKLLHSGDPAVARAARQTLEPMVDDDSRRVATLVRRLLDDEPGRVQTDRPSPVATEPAAAPAFQDIAAEAAGSVSVPVPGLPAGPQGADLAAPPGVHTAGVVAVAASVIVLVSVLADSYGGLGTSPYKVPVALMWAGVIVLIGYTLRVNRRAPLLAATALALVALGETFPLGWDWGGSAFPAALAFWSGAVGGATAAAGAALASWLAYDVPGEAGETPSMPGPALGRLARLGLAISGPVIVIVSLFVLDEWSQGTGARSTWSNWPAHRYPVAVIVLAAVVVGLAFAGIRSRRQRAVAAAAAVACLLLGESVPLFFATTPHWGPGRWLRIGGAVLAVVAVSWAAATTVGMPADSAHG